MYDNISVIEFGIQLDYQRYAARKATDAQLGAADRETAAKIANVYVGVLEKMCARLLEEFDHLSATAQ